MCNREISSRGIDYFFSVKLYDHQGPIARGGGGLYPLTVRVMRNALTGRGLIHMSLVTMLLRRRREILHFEITEPINNGIILLIMAPSFTLPGGVSDFSTHLNSHEANADAAGTKFLCFEITELLLSVKTELSNLLEFYS